MTEETCDCLSFLDAQFRDMSHVILQFCWIASMLPFWWHLTCGSLEFLLFPIASACCFA